MGYVGSTASAVFLGPMPKRLDAGDSLNPSPLMIERGQKFGAWFRSGVERSGKNINVLADEIKVSRQLLYAYRDNCIGSDKRYRKPSEAMVDKIARGLNLNSADGRRAMGYASGAEGTSFAVPFALSNLTADAQQALARAVQIITESAPVEIVRERESENPNADIDPEFAALYRDADDEDRELARQILQRAQRRQSAKSIGGGVPKDEK